MDLAEMKKVANRFHKEMIQHNKTEIIPEICATDIKIISPFVTPENPRMGHAGAKEMSDADHEAFPDGLFFDQGEDSMVAEGDWVVVQWDAHGINKGPFGPCAPLNKEVKFSGTDLYKFNGEGKIAEAWVYYDALGVFKQFGAELTFPE